MKRCLTSIGVSCALMASTCEETSMISWTSWYGIPAFRKNTAIENHIIAVFTVAISERKKYLVGKRYHINNTVWFLIERCARSPPKSF